MTLTCHTSTQPRTVIAAAHAIRPNLPTLLNAETAQQVQQLDQRLQDLLTQAESGQLSEQSAEALITEELRQFDPTRVWMRRYREGENPEQITRSLSYSGLGGDPTLQPATKYVCPQANCGTEPWYREGNEAIPLCETHLVCLVPAQS
jgi:HPt (histidine-containing phosphotransfer) domain-containing protein